jgi:hypothetical protein
MFDSKWVRIRGRSEREKPLVNVNVPREEEVGAPFVQDVVDCAEVYFRLHIPSGRKVANMQLFNR